MATVVPELSSLSWDDLFSSDVIRLDFDDEHTDVGSAERCLHMPKLLTCKLSPYWRQSLKSWTTGVGNNSTESELAHVQIWLLVAQKMAECAATAATSFDIPVPGSDIEITLQDHFLVDSDFGCGGNDFVIESSVTSRVYCYMCRDEISSKQLEDLSTSATDTNFRGIISQYRRRPSLSAYDEVYDNESTIDLKRADLRNLTGCKISTIVDSLAFVASQKTFSDLIGALKLSDMWMSDEVSLIILGLIQRKAKLLHDRWDVDYITSWHLAWAKWLSSPESKQHEENCLPIKFFHKEMGIDGELYMERGQDALDLVSTGTTACGDNFGSRFPGMHLKGLVDTFVFIEHEWFRKFKPAIQWGDNHPALGNRILTSLSKAMGDADFGDMEFDRVKQRSVDLWQWGQMMLTLNQRKSKERKALEVEGEGSISPEGRT